MCFTNYEACSKSMCPLAGKNNIYHLEILTSITLQSMLLGAIHTSPITVGSISGTSLWELSTDG